MRLARAKEDALRVVLVPVVCGLAAVGLLAYDHFSRLDGLKVTLRAITLPLAADLTGLVFAEKQRVLAQSRQEAHTHVLTGLRNRRTLMSDLDEALPLSTEVQALA